MLELIDHQPELSVQESEYQRLLGYPGGHVLEGRPRELADWAGRWYTEHGKPWIYARSVIPSQSLRGDLQRLRKLRNSSLGALLFRYPQLQRTPFEIASVTATTLPQPLGSDAMLWARRSRFAIDKRALIVGEIFLDDFMKALVQKPALRQLR